MCCASSSSPSSPSSDRKLHTLIETPAMCRGFRLLHRCRTQAPPGRKSLPTPPRGAPYAPRQPRRHGATGARSAPHVRLPHVGTSALFLILAKKPHKKARSVSGRKDSNESEGDKHSSGGLRRRSFSYRDRSNSCRGKSAVGRGSAPALRRYRNAAPRHRETRARAG